MECELCLQKAVILKMNSCWIIQSFPKTHSFIFEALRFALKHRWGIFLWFKTKTGGRWKLSSLSSATHCPTVHQPVPCSPLQGTRSDPEELLFSFKCNSSFFPFKVDLTLSCHRRKGRQSGSVAGICACSPCSVGMQWNGGVGSCSLFKSSPSLDSIRADLDLLTQVQNSPSQRLHSPWCKCSRLSMIQFTVSLRNGSWSTVTWNRLDIKLCVQNDHGIVKCKSDLSSSEVCAHTRWTLCHEQTCQSEGLTYRIGASCHLLPYTLLLQGFNRNKIYLTFCDIKLFFKYFGTICLSS